MSGGKGMADSQGTQLASVETLLEMPGCVPNALLAAVLFSSSSNVVLSPARFWPPFCNGRPKRGAGKETSETSGNEVTVSSAFTPPEERGLSDN